ncbi:hypothetical protein [Paenibacillus hamazuiensis]|uniref:hypothetical protein n=1 Tax=Paenibacillus hamazuiensis TaxID=2936508 RepID=UPI00200EA2FE|nr:hypothetical protein [Paenibacillus hamazuiensis]
MVKIKQCVMCGCKDVPNAILEVDVGVYGIVSANINGCRCSSCGEEHYDLETLYVIERLQKGLADQAINDLRNPQKQNDERA